jgi:hypothetical protein
VIDNELAARVLALEQQLARSETSRRDLQVAALQRDNALVARVLTLEEQMADSEASRRDLHAMVLQREGLATKVLTFKSIFNALRDENVALEKAPKRDTHLQEEELKRTQERLETLESISPSTTEDIKTVRSLLDSGAERIMEISEQVAELENFRPYAVETISRLTAMESRVPYPSAQASGPSPFRSKPVGSGLSPLQAGGTCTRGTEGGDRHADHGASPPAVDSTVPAPRFGSLESTVSPRPMSQSDSAENVSLFSGSESEGSGARTPCHSDFDGSETKSEYQSNPFVDNPGQSTAADSSLPRLLCQHAKITAQALRTIKEAFGRNQRLEISIHNSFLFMEVPGVEPHRKCLLPPSN